MASPPFDIAETTPSDGGIPASFPLAERTFRDIVESWLTTFSDPATGKLKAAGFPSTLAITSTVLSTGTPLSAISTTTSAAQAPGVDAYRQALLSSGSDIGFFGFPTLNSGTQKVYMAWLQGVVDNSNDGNEAGRINVYLAGNSTQSGIVASFQAVDENGVEHPSFNVGYKYSAGGSSNTAGISLYAAGNMSIRSAVPGFLQLNKTNGVDGPVQGFYDGGSLRGSISVGNTGVTYGTSSDERKKENFRDFDPGKVIDGIEWKRFDFKAEFGGAKDQYGAIAQQVMPIFPQAVANSADGFYDIDYGKFSPLFGQELKNLRQRVKALEEKKGD